MIKITESFLRKFKTACLYLSFLSLGLCMAIPGPTLLDLQSVVQTDTSHIAYIYLARSGGYLCGSFIGGIILDCVEKKQPLLMVLNSVMATSAFVIPWSRNVLMLMFTMAVGGLSMGALDTGGNVWCLDLWGEHSGPYFQALHFLFGLGAFLSPLIAEPFLSQKKLYGCHEELTHFEESSDSQKFLSISQKNCSYKSFNISNTSDSNNSIPSVTYAYTIIGGFSLCVCLMFVALFFISPYEKKQTLNKQELKYKEPDIIHTVVVVSLTTVLLCIYAGIEIGYGQMIATFAVMSNFKLSKSTGSYMTSVFWGTFTFSRGVSIFLAAKFSPLSLTLCDLILMILGGIILNTLGTYYVEFLWVGTAVLGISLASFYPSTISWVEKHVTISNKVASSFVVAASLGEMIVPLVVSQFVDSKPEVLLYVVITSEVLCCVLTFILWLITKKMGIKRVIDKCEQNDFIEIEDAEISDMHATEDTKF